MGKKKKKDKLPDLTCMECGYEFDGQQGDVCPKCGARATVKNTATERV